MCILEGIRQGQVEKDEERLTWMKDLLMEVIEPVLKEAAIGWGRRAYLGQKRRAYDLLSQVYDLVGTDEGNGQRLR